MKPFSKKTANSLLRWYIAQPDSERYRCHEEQRQRISFLGNEARKRDEKLEIDGKIQYDSFLFAIDKCCRIHSNKRLRSNDNLEAVTAKRIATEKAKMKAKPSPKLDRLLTDLRPVVEKLRDEGMSWQKVADYLARFHKCRYSRGYLQKVFAETKFWKSNGNQYGCFAFPFLSLLFWRFLRDWSGSCQYGTQIPLLCIVYAVDGGSDPWRFRRELLSEEITCRVKTLK